MRRSMPSRKMQNCRLCLTSKDPMMAHSTVLANQVAIPKLRSRKQVSISLSPAFKWTSSTQSTTQQAMKTWPIKVTWNGSWTPWRSYCCRETKEYTNWWVITTRIMIKTPILENMLTCPLNLEVPLLLCWDTKTERVFKEVQAVVVLKLWRTTSNKNSLMGCVHSWMKLTTQ